MIKRLGRFALLLMLAALFVPVVAAQGQGVLVDLTVVRSGPSEFAPRNGNPFPAGALVNVIARDTDSEWYFVRRVNAGTEGWVDSENVAFDGDVPLGTADAAVSADTLNLYGAPDQDRAVLETLADGEQVTITATDVSETWYFIQRPDDAFNWAPARGIEVLAGNPEGFPVYTTVDSDPVGEDGNGEEPDLDSVTAVDAQIYFGPTTAAPASDLIPANTPVNVIVQDDERAWYFVRNEARDLEGWVRSGTVAFDGAIAQGTALGVSVVNSLNLYDAPMNDATVLDILPSGEDVVVSSQDSTQSWYYVQSTVDGEFYWAPAQNIRLTVSGNPSNVPVWETIPSEEYGEVYQPTFFGLTNQQADVVSRIFSDAEPVVLESLNSAEIVTVIAQTETDTGYYLIRLPGGELGWIESAAVDVIQDPENIPEI